MRFSLVTLGSILLLPGSWAFALAAPPDPPTPAVDGVSRPVEGPVSIFLKTPADRDEFWRMLARPDFVILEGDLYRKLRLAAETGRPPIRSSAATVESVAIGGGVEGDWARLTVDLRISLERDDPTWVPIQLDGLTLSEVREGDRDLPARPAEDRSWSIELAGRREHLVRVGVMAPVRVTPGGRRLEVAIPPAASTRLGLDVGQPILSATVGDNEPVAVGPSDGNSGRSRISARLGPRPRLDLTWREPPSADLRVSPLLSCQGNIAVDVEPGSIQTRSSWLVTALRGSASRLTIRLDPAEEVVEVQVGVTPILFDPPRREAGRLVLVVPLPGPISGSQSASLVITSRRAFATPGPARVILQGYAFDEAKSQSGVLAVSRIGPLFLNPTPGRALRRIDPRSDLPEGLRARQDTALAFEFNDQPFELQLGIDPAPPRLQIEARTTLALTSRSARVETQLDCRVAQGRPFEARISIPDGLIFDEAGPAELVASAQILGADPEGAPDLAARARTLVITLNRQARESGRFLLTLRGHASIDPSRPVRVPLFRPPAESSDGGRIEIRGDRDISVELDEPRDESTSFRQDIVAGPASGASPVLLALRHDGDPAFVPLRVAILPRTIRLESTLTATVDRKGAEVVEDVSLEVDHGTLAALDLIVPPEVPGEWKVEGLGQVVPVLLGREPDGSRRFRVAIARGDAGSFRLRFRYRASIVEAATPGGPARFRLAPIRIVEGTSAACVARIVTEAGVEPKAEGPGWSAVDPGPSTESGPTTGLALARAVEGAGPIEVALRARESVPLPGLIASRLWLRTTQRADGDLATSAHYWLETWRRSIALDLPPGSRWVRARVGGVDLGPDDVVRSGPNAYRIEVPGSVAPGPALLAIEYLAAASATLDGWPAPGLRDGLIGQTLWEFHTIGTRAGVGVPRDWTDENEWFWDGLLWRRRPARTPAEIGRWLTGGAPSDRIAESSSSGEAEGTHGYLFSRPGPPATLRFLVHSRLWLLLFCSGPVLVAGLLILARRTRPRLWTAAGLLAAFAVGVLLDFDAALLVVQSSALGFLLLLGAIGMTWILDHKAVGFPPPVPGRAEQDRVTISATGHAATVGHDDSTAIRPRPSPPAPSTADHIILKRPGAHGEEEPLTTDLNLR